MNPARLLSSSPWDHPGRPSPVVLGLIGRIAPHSPDLVILIERYLKAKGEPLAGRMTYSEGDPSIQTTFFLIEALLSFERLRIELLEQTDAHKKAGERIPGHLMVAISEMLSMEPALIQNLSVMLEIHLQIWDAAGGHYLSADEVKERKKKKKKANRGRWGDS